MEVTRVECQILRRIYQKLGHRYTAEKSITNVIEELKADKLIPEDASFRLVVISQYVNSTETSKRRPKQISDQKAQQIQSIADRMLAQLRKQQQ